MLIANSAIKTPDGVEKRGYRVWGSAKTSKELPEFGRRITSWLTRLGIFDSTIKNTRNRFIREFDIWNYLLITPVVTGVNGRWHLLVEPASSLEVPARKRKKFSTAS